MGSSNDASVLDALERAEMAARERRLAASSEAEDIVSAAQQRASVITAGVGRCVDETLDELRHATEVEADAVIADLERVAAGRGGVGPGATHVDPAFEHAVAVVVAHVLGEGSSEPTDGERT